MEKLWSGRLHLLGPRTDGLWIRDAVGNDVRLDEVADLDMAVRFVGDQVTATGRALLGGRGQVTTLVGARIERLVMPNWATPRILEACGIRRTRDVMSGVDGVDEQEVAAFLGLIGR